MKKALLEAIADCLRNDAQIECVCNHQTAEREGAYHSVCTAAYGGPGKAKNLVSVFAFRDIVVVYIPRITTLDEFQQRYGFPAKKIMSDQSTMTTGKPYHCVEIDSVYFDPLIKAGDTSTIRRFLVAAVRKSLPLRGISDAGRAKLQRTASLVKLPSLKVLSPATSQGAKAPSGSDPHPDFTKALFELYRQTLKQTGYNAHYFHNMLQEMPGFDVARQLISVPDRTEGFLRLYHLHKLELTLEAIILQPRWAPLFSDDEKLAAYNRLEAHSYKFPVGSWKPSQNKTPPPPLPLTPPASDLEEGPAGRVKTTTYRILRDTELARRVKELHKGFCQICGKTIKLPDGTNYAEAHHILPLGEPHNGPDVIGNIICVCPNHHAELDYRVSPLSLAELKSVPSHTIDQKYVDSHNRFYQESLSASRC